LQFTVYAYLCPHLAKKRIISSLLLCVFAIIFAHSVVPHHHEEEHSAHQQSSHGNDQDDIDDNFLGQAFSHFQHEQSSTLVYETVSADYHCSKVIIDKGTVLFVQFILQAIHKPPIEHPPIYPVRLTPQFGNSADFLRGPPSAMA
jgi:hypothetical protein